MPSRGSPRFTFRLPAKDLEALREVAKLCGLTSGAFLAQMVGAVVSSDHKRIADFVAQLAAKMGEQLTLDLQAKQAPLPAKRKRKGGRRGRST